MAVVAELLYFYSKQKEPPYSKTLSKGHFPINIISASASRNINR